MNNAVREKIIPLTTDPHIFIGKKPAAVLFGNERVDTPTWKKVYAAILMRCNENPQNHESLMYLRGRVAGKCRVFLAESPDGMRSPVKIDENMFAETHYGSETLMHILVRRILAPVRFDISDINIIVKS